MDAQEVKRIVDEELKRGEVFWNFHGIDNENVAFCLVEPYEVIVDPDDLETLPRPMWVVLHEHPGEENPGVTGYLIVYDPDDPSGPNWGIAERYPTGEYVAVTKGDKSFVEALKSM